VDALTLRDAERYRWAVELTGNAETLYWVVMGHEGNQDKINERVDSYRAPSAHATNKDTHD
jgi:hypothetical protein